MIDRRPPDITLTVDDGMDPLTYRLCSVCLTLQTRIASTLPVVCQDCADVVAVTR
jgi:hypothetical protein